MKRMLLTCGVVLLAGHAMSQVIFSVQAPAVIEGGYDFTSNGNGSSWGLANLNDPADAILDTVVIVDDGSPGMNAQGNPIAYEGCNTLVNDLTGKIAMIYRNTCSFGVKALNAQNAGAIGVIIVNREPGLVNMTGGTEGGSVTIPVTFISSETGLLLRQQIDAGEDVVVFIGNKQGNFPDDLGVNGDRALRAEFGSLPSQLAMNSSDLTVPMGIWGYNYGSANQSNVSLNVTVTRGATEVYNQTTSAVNIPSGDSSYYSVADLGLSSYPAGTYEIKYTLSSGVADDYVLDNSYTSNFSISDSLYSLTPLDPADVVAYSGSLGGNDGTVAPADFQGCFVFSNPNASRIVVDGLYHDGFYLFASDSATIETLAGQEVEANLFQWDDAGTTEADATFDALIPLGTANYTFTGDYRDSTMYYAFDEPVMLDDNQKYLACMRTYSAKIYHHYDSKVSYALNEDNDQQLRVPFLRGDTWSIGYVGLPSPSIAMKTSANDAGVNDESLVPASSYPNPAVSNVTVLVNGSGDAELKVTDLSGRLVHSGMVKIAQGKFTVDVTGMNSGTYVFDLSMANGTTSRFKVVVTK